jgi:hypothetical protein
MNFLYPGFLFALLAIAIPIVIHLFNFRRYKKIYFSNVQFLKEAKEQNSSREKLKNLLILSSRILAIAFLVLAFARPYIPTASTANPAATHVVSIYIDNSYSMETVNKEGSLLDEAKRKAREIVEGYGLNDQFRLITNDFEGRHQRLVSKEEFIQLLDDIKISAVSRTLQQVVNRQQSATSGNTNQSSYIISDFQKGFAGSKPIQMQPGLSQTLIKLKANSLPNISVDSIWSLSPIHRPGGNEQFVVKLRNYGGEHAAEMPIRLSINNQQKALSNVSVKAGESVNDTLSFSNSQLVNRTTSEWLNGSVSIKDFPLTFDDQLNFSFKVSNELKVLSIAGNSSNIFIKALFSADKYFSLTEMPESNVNYAALANYRLIVLSGLKQPSSGLAQQLKGYLQNGGSVVIFPDLTVAPEVYRTFLTSLSLPAVEQLNTGAAVSSTIDLKNPLFADVFDQVPRNMDLPVVNSYFAYANRSKSSVERILSLPFNRFLFGGFTSGQGKVYLSATSLEIKDSNLPRHAVFVPLMYKIAFASAKSHPLYYTLGSDNLLETEKINLLPNQSLKLTSADAEIIPELRQTPGKTLLYVADQVKKSGFYSLKSGDSILALVAFNDQRMESDMHYATEKELENLFGKEKVNVYSDRKDAKSLNIAIKNSSAELWKLCIILAVVFLAIEILLIRFFNNPKSRQKA